MLQRGCQRAARGTRAALGTGGAPFRFMLLAVLATDAITSLVVFSYGNEYLIRTLHAPTSYPALALGLYGLVKLATAPGGGWLLDRLHARRIAGASWALECLGLVVVLVTRSAPGYLAGVALLSMGIALGWLVVLHFLSVTTHEASRGRVAAAMGLAAVGGNVAGFGLALLATRTGEWETAFVLGVLLSSAAGLLLIQLDAAGLGMHVELGPQPAGRAGPGEPPSGREQLTVASVEVAHFAAITATVAALTPFLLRTLDLRLDEIAFLLAPAAATAVASMLVAGRLSRPGRRPLEFASMYAVGAGALLLISQTSTERTFTMSAVPLGLAMGALTAIVNAWVLDTAREAERSGVTLGRLVFAEGLGSFAGPLLIAAIIARLGLRPSIVAIGCFYLAVIGLAITSFKPRR